MLDGGLPDSPNPVSDPVKATFGDGGRGITDGGREITVGSEILLQQQ